MTPMSSLWLSIKVYQDKRSDFDCPLDTLVLDTFEVCIDSYIDAWNEAKFMVECSQYIEEDVYIRICEWDSVVFEWNVIEFKPWTTCLWYANITLWDSRFFLTEKDRSISQDYSFVDSSIDDVLTQLFSGLSQWQFKENRCITTPNDVTITEDYSCGQQIGSILEDISNKTWYKRDILPSVDENGQRCCNIIFDECLWIDRTKNDLNYTEIVFDGKITQWNTVSKVDLIWRSRRKNQVIAKAEIWWTQQVVVIDDWEWCIVGTEVFETDAVDLADLQQQAEEKLIDVNQNKRVYKVWVEQDAVDANVWDKLRLLVTRSQCWIDVDTTVTVLRKTVCYKWGVRTETVYVWDPSIKVPTRRQVLDNLVNL